MSSRLFQKTTRITQVIFSNWHFQNQDARFRCRRRSLGLVYSLWLCRGDKSFHFAVVSCALHVYSTFFYYFFFYITTIINWNGKQLFFFTENYNCLHIFYWRAFLMFSLVSTFWKEIFSLLLDFVWIHLSAKNEILVGTSEVECINSWCDVLKYQAIIMLYMNCNHSVRLYNKINCITGQECHAIVLAAKYKLVTKHCNKRFLNAYNKS